MKKNILNIYIFVILSGLSSDLSGVTQAKSEASAEGEAKNPANEIERKKNKLYKIS